MKVLKKLKSNSKGQSAVLFAIALPFLFGIIAFAIDLGLVTYEMVKLQNSADLAVMNGVQYLPLNPVEAENTTRSIFKENYGTEDPIQNLLVLNSLTSVKVNYEKEVKLYFLPIVGKTSFTIKGKAEAVIEPLVRPHTIIPMAISHTTPFVFNQEVILFGELNDPVRGNFGLIDPTEDNRLKPNDYEELIANDYKGEFGMPEAGEEITTRPGVLGHRVKNGLIRRLSSDNPYIICPVVDFSQARGKSTVTIKGYVRFKVTEVISGTGRHVTIKGIFVEYIEPKGDGNGAADDYGIKAIRLKE
jgi:hypothetical protein